MCFTHKTEEERNEQRFQDKSDKRGGGDNAASFIRIYDTLARCAHRQRRPPPTLDQSTRGFTYCTLRHAHTLISGWGWGWGLCMLYAKMTVDGTHLLDKRSERDPRVRENSVEGS